MFRSILFTLISLVFCTSTAIAQGWPGRKNIEPSSKTLAPISPVPTTTLHFDELSFQPVNGLTFSGVRFAFTINGVGSTDASYHALGPGQITFVQDPSLEGNAAGVLVLDFLSPTSVVQFGLALNTFDRLNPGATVKLFDSSLFEIRTFNVHTSSLISFSENQFTYSGPPDVKRVVISFSNSVGRFSLDNLGFSTSSPPTGTGTIRVDSAPVGAGFQLVGPGLTFFSNITPFTVSHAQAGSYKIIWNILLGGFATPPEEIKSLEKNQTISFFGQYVAAGGVQPVRPIPMSFDSVGNRTDISQKFDNPGGRCGPHNGIDYRSPLNNPILSVGPKRRHPQIHQTRCSRVWFVKPRSQRPSYLGEVHTRLGRSDLCALRTYG